MCEIRCVPFLLGLMAIITCGVVWCDGRIICTAVLYRHGDRTPVDPYPTDPYRDEALWPVPFGQLTNRGKVQHYKLGRYLRSRYVGLMSRDFLPDEMYVRSTDVDRTLMSAQANLAGFYPPTGRSQWNNNIQWQPIPVHTVPEELDALLGMQKQCPAYNNAFAELKNSKSYKDRLNTYKSLMDYLTEHTGEQVKDYEQILSIFSVLNIEKLYNFTLPKWTTSVFPAKMVEPAAYSFKLTTFTPKLARLRMGPLLTHIVNNMNEVAHPTLDKDGKKKKKGYKMLMFSAHDLNVAEFLNGLDLFDGECPAYTATVFIDLIDAFGDVPVEGSGTLLVRISYRNATGVNDPHVLNIPLCGELCPLSRFITTYNHLIINDWDTECQDVPYTTAWWGIFFLVNILIIIMVAGGVKVYRMVRFCFKEDKQEDPVSRQPIINTVINANEYY